MFVYELSGCGFKSRCCHLGEYLFILFLGNIDTRSKVPIIRILLRGGPVSIKFILAGLKQKPPVPVVIISDSGKAADILAYAHR